MEKRKLCRRNLRILILTAIILGICITISASLYLQLHVAQLFIRNDVAHVLRLNRRNQPVQSSSNSRKISSDNLSQDGNSSFADIRYSLSDLMLQMADHWQWKFIRNRIQGRWSDWVVAAKMLKKKNPLYMQHRLRQKILVMPLLTTTSMSLPIVIAKGGPVGELVQWSDLIASLHVLGHDVLLMHDMRQVSRRLSKLDGQKNACSLDFDAIYTDYAGLSVIGSLDKFRNRLRILDVYGTEAIFTQYEYVQKHQPKNLLHYAHNLHTKQFYTMYGATPDNNFIGFAVVPKNTTRPKRDLAVLYGKDINYFMKQRQFLDKLVSLVPNVIATISPKEDIMKQIIPKEVELVGRLEAHNFSNLLSSAKMYVGVGQPLEGPAAVEALSQGCAFINPKCKGVDQEVYINSLKPTTRLITSQVPYLEKFFGPPYVYTVDTENETEVEIAVKDALRNNLKPLVPYEFSMEGYLQRLEFFTQEIDFCEDHMSDEYKRSFNIRLSDEGEHCNDHCENAGLVCDTIFFHKSNKESIFTTLNIKCDSYLRSSEVYFPGFVTHNNTCILQNNEKMFSCAFAHKGVKRVCPCRDFNPEQRSLCKECFANKHSFWQNIQSAISSIFSV